MSDDQALPLPPDFDAWLDDSDHNALWLSIGDDCWQGIAYEMALAAFAAGAAQGAATEREACAQVAEQHDAFYLAGPSACTDMKLFADLIRARTTP